jgi:hypothetical protein
MSGRSLRRAIGKGNKEKKGKATNGSATYNSSKRFCFCREVSLELSRGCIVTYWKRWWRWAVVVVGAAVGRESRKKKKAVVRAGLLLIPRCPRLLVNLFPKGVTVQVRKLHGPLEEEGDGGENGDKRQRWCYKALAVREKE